MSNSSQYPQLPPSEPPPTAAHSNHGGTPAAWTLMAVTAVGAVIAGVGVAMQSSPVILAGAIVVAVGIVAGIALRLAGKGQPPLLREVPEDDDLAHLRSPAATQDTSPTPAVITQGTEPGSQPSEP